MFNARFVPHRSLSGHRARYMMSTALVSLGLAIFGATGAVAQETPLDLYLNNEPPQDENGYGQGNGVWDDDARIWSRRNDFDPDNRQAVGDETNVRVILPANPSQPSVELTIGSDLALAEVRAAHDGYRLTAAVDPDNPQAAPVMRGWRDGETLSFSMAPGVTLNVDGVRLGGAVAVTGGGVLHYDGNSSGVMDSLRVGRGTALVSTGTTAGQMTNRGHATIATHNGDIVTAGTGQLVLNAGSQVSGDVRNDGTDSHVEAAGTIGGALVNQGTTEVADDLSAGSVANLQGTLTVGAGVALNVTDVGGEVLNAARMNLSGTLGGNLRNTAGDEGEGLYLDGGRIIGHLMNSTGYARINGDSRVDGRLQSGGAVDLRWGSNLRVGALENLAGRFQTRSGSRLTVDGAASNAGYMVLRGQFVADELVNEADGHLITDDSALVESDLVNEAGGRIELQGQVTGQLDNRSDDDRNYLAGAVANGGLESRTLNVAGGIVNSGALNVIGNLETSTFDNSGGLTVRANGVVTTDADEALQNTGRVTVSGGLVKADIVNDGSGRVFLRDGRIVGDVSTGRDALLQGSGHVEGTVENSGTVAARAAPAPGGGNLLEIDRLENSDQGRIEVDDGRRLRIGNRLSNDGHISVDGEFEAAGLINLGTVDLRGRIDVDTLHNGDSLAGETGSIDMLGGTVGGHLVNRGGSSVTGVGRIEQDLRNEGLVTVTSGQGPGNTLRTGTLENRTSGRIVVREGSNLTTDTGGINSGRIDVEGTLETGGELRNTDILNVADSGEVRGDLRNEGGALVSSGRIRGRLDNLGDTSTAELSGRVDGLITNTGTIDLAGQLQAQGGLDNRGTLNVDERLALGGGSVLRNSGTTNLTGEIAGNVVNGDSDGAGTFNLDEGRIEGGLDNGHAGSIVAGTGQIDGTLRNIGTVEVQGNGDSLTVGRLENAHRDATVNIHRDHDLNLQDGGSNAGTIAVDGRLDVQGGVLENTNTGQLQVAADGEVSGRVANSGSLTVDGEVTGRIENRSGGTANLNNRVTGSVDNAGGTVNATGTITGEVTNSGSFNLEGDLSVGSLENTGAGMVAIESDETLTVTDGSVVNRAGTSEQDNRGLDIAGRLDGSLENSGRTWLGYSDQDAAAVVTGNVLNTGTVSLREWSTVEGDFTNRGLLHSDTPGLSSLTVGGVFVNASGTIRGGEDEENAIVIRADNVVQQGLVSGIVHFLGRVENGGTIIYDFDRVLDDALINTESGTIRVEADVDADGHEITNQGDFAVRDGGNLHGVSEFANSGRLSVEQNGQFQAGLLTNSGENGEIRNSGLITADIDNGALLHSTGTIDGNLANNGQGTAELAGTVTGDIVSGGELRTVGDLTARSLLNDTTGEAVISSGTTLRTDETVRNRGQMTVAGRVENDLHTEGSGRTVLDGGTIAGNVHNGGTFGGDGSVTGDLANTGAVQVAQGDRLAVGGRTVNSGMVSVDNGGVLASDIRNGGAGSIQLAGSGAIQGDVENLGALTGQGRIEGDVQNLGDATFRLAGTVTGTLTHSADRVLSTYADSVLQVGALENNRQVTVAAGSTLAAAQGTDNRGTMRLNGVLGGDLRTTANSQVFMGGGHLEGNLVNRGVVTGQGTVRGELRNAEGGQLRLDGAIDGRLVNNGTVGVFRDTVLASNHEARNNATFNVAGTYQGDIRNTATGTTNVTAQGTVDGSLINNGTLSSRGTITGNVENSAIGKADLRGRIGGLLTNRGEAVTTGDLRVGGLTNRADMTVGADSVLYSETLIDNTARLNVLGEIVHLAPGTMRATATAAADPAPLTVLNREEASLDVSGRLGTNLRNLGQAVVRQTGRIGGLVWNEDGGLLQSLGVIEGDLFNLAGGEAQLAGAVEGDLINEGRVLTTGELALGGLVTNEGAVTNVQAGSDVTLAEGETALNLGHTVVQGTLTGDLGNAASGVLRMQGGILRGDVVNDGGRVWGAGVIDGQVASNSTVQVVEGDRLGVTGGVFNQGGAVNVAGTLDGDVTSVEQGRAVLNGGTVTGYFHNLGSTLNASGAVIGTDLLNDADGVANLRGGTTVGRNVVNSGELNVTNSTIAGALRNRGGTVNLQGATVSGNLGNTAGGTVTAQGSRVQGELANNGTVTLANGTTGEVFTIGGLSGEGVFRLDLDLIDMTSDMIRVTGGPATGHHHFAFDLRTPEIMRNVGQAITIMEVDGRYGSANDFTFTADDLPAISERIVYSVDRNFNSGNLQVVSQINPAIGAILGNVALTHSLIGSVINRPTSPYVVGRAYALPDDPCGYGSWGRAIGGQAEATGATDNGVSRVESTVNATYYGMQVGTDLACFDGHFNGWDMAFGGVLGVNRGDTRQPIYGIDPTNSGHLSDALASVTSTDFDQIYGGVYVTGSKDRWTFDLQYRHERTEFEIENRAVVGDGLGLADNQLKSDGFTVSGALSYSIPVGESGWQVVPTAGFAWSRLDIGDLTFEDGFRLEFDKTERKVGFVGGTLTRTFVQPQDNAALNIFATGTYYKDFASRTASTFGSDNEPEFEPQRLLSDHLGAYSELSLGANYVKVLQRRNGRPMQFSAGSRIDARIGDNMDSVGVTGQFRFQF
ncbi:hypothetical protein [uncultured Paracoccus sp.]|uniref:hypothetical protein n=1 Tax=uncultured Paracoccus sp. TaxID=189685 RepID=UPI0025CD377B|nr:hypothetical protein [uncultured Paracoccus sp.]